MTAVLGIDHFNVQTASASHYSCKVFMGINREVALFHQRKTKGQVE